MNTTDKIIWLDGHTTTISSEEAFLRTREVYTDDGYEHIMKYADSEFVWRDNCWQQLYIGLISDGILIWKCKDWAEWNQYKKEHSDYHKRQGTNHEIEFSYDFFVK